MTEVLVGPYEFVNPKKTPSRITLAIQTDNIIEQRFYHDNGVKAEKNKCATFDDALKMVESLIATYKLDRYLDQDEVKEQKKAMQSKQSMIGKRKRDDQAQ